MRRAILKKFILVLLAALCINSVIFYLISSHMILKMAREDMTYTIEMIDRLLDYEDESYLAVQIERMEEFTGADDTRVTLIHLDGTVVSDTDTSTEDLDNHLSRKEVKEALLNGMGYAKRYSKTMGKHFLYVAFQSHRSDMILRISVPYSGFNEYLPMLLPAALVSLSCRFSLCICIYQAVCGFRYKTLAGYCFGASEGEGRKRGAPFFALSVSGAECDRRDDHGNVK